jgi:hypothetical protein
MSSLQQNLPDTTLLRCSLSVGCLAERQFATDWDHELAIANSFSPIEGHCDDRGSEEYNTELGQRRAQSLKKQLLQSGIDETRVRTISHGKEKPFCTVDDEAFWQENRRDHIAPQQ